MKEDSKYYTPEISEFYVGFEFEVLGVNNRWELGSDMCIPKYYLPNEAKSYRVKYLDRQDIIDLGWEHLSKLGHLMGFSLNEFHLAFDEETKRVIINDYPKTRIDCKIKNKSELKKIMRMLEII